MNKQMKYSAEMVEAIAIALANGGRIRTQTIKDIYASDSWYSAMKKLEGNVFIRDNRDPISVLRIIIEDVKEDGTPVLPSEIPKEAIDRANTIKQKRRDIKHNREMYEKLKKYDKTKPIKNGDE